MNKKELWQKILHFAITILTAIATTLQYFYNTLLLFYKVLKMKTLKNHILREWRLVRGFCNLDEKKLMGGYKK